MEENLNSVNAETVEVVTPHEDVQANEVESVSSEVATEQPVKPVQSPEENAKFKEIITKEELEELINFN